MRLQESTENTGPQGLAITTAQRRSSAPTALAFPRPEQYDGVERRTAALGWLSLSLGVAQLVAPRGVARLIGVDANARTELALRALGLRELSCGVGILTHSRPASWSWARVAGDLMDLALLASVFGARNTERPRLLAATALVAGVTLLDAKTALDLQRKQPAKVTWPGFTARTAITINRSREEVYRHWRDFGNLPYFMQYLDDVRVDPHNDRRSHWRAKGPLGVPVEWDAEIVEDRVNELIAWRSVDVADVPNRGTVRFELAPGGRATEVHVEIRYYPPAGALGKVVAKVFGADPAHEVRQDLRRFKQVMEMGEVMRSDASIHSGMHNARPPRVTPQPTKVIS
ncbi:MAG: SRPBCC family protein [Polyangiaceae bacterium]